MGHVPVAQPTPPRRFRLSRRGPAVALLLATLVAVLAVAVLVAWPTGSQVQPPHGGWVTVGAEEDFQLWTPKAVAFSDASGEEYRVFIVRLPEETLALSRASPYKGCSVPWRPDYEFLGRTGWFKDPCHSATFDLTGHMVAGPSPRGLDRFDARIEEGDVQVNTRELILGPLQDPERVPATPP